MIKALIGAYRKAFPADKLPQNYKRPTPRHKFIANPVIFAAASFYLQPLSVYQNYLEIGRQQSEASRNRDLKHLVCPTKLPAHPKVFGEFLRENSPGSNVDFNRITYDVSKQAIININPRDFPKDSSVKVGEEISLSKGNEIFQNWSIPLDNGKKVPFRSGNKVNVQQSILPVLKNNEHSAIVLKTNPTNSNTDNQVVALVGVGASSNFTSGIPRAIELLRYSFENQIPIIIIISSLPGHSSYGGETLKGLNTDSNKNIKNCTLTESTSNQGNPTIKYDEAYSNLANFLKKHSKIYISAESTSALFALKMLPALSQNSKIKVDLYSPFLGEINEWSKISRDFASFFISEINEVVSGQNLTQSFISPSEFSTNAYLRSDGKVKNLSINKAPENTPKSQQNTINEILKVPQARYYPLSWVKHIKEYWEGVRGLTSLEKLELNVAISTGDPIVSYHKTTQELNNIFPKTKITPIKSNEHNLTTNTKEPEFRSIVTDSIRKSLNSLVDSSNQN
ncbi:MAG: hypothetical protein QNJ31_05645 [Candidatus Caenarcaniphilales bacterium]|nr:hypothetical protein [Candidatus Caenarcaniphilales bacterium]